jgi:prepilin-type N-terminal cleavage/methylation domain-containing protein
LRPADEDSAVARTSTTHIRSDRAFTLIELLVVIVVLGIVSALILFAVGSTRDDALVSACKAEVLALDKANAAYKIKSATGSNAPDVEALLAGHHLNGTLRGGVKFANGVTNPATVEDCESAAVALPPVLPLTPDDNTLVVSALNGTTIRSGRSHIWRATISVTVTNASGDAVPDVQVTGTWDDGVTDESGCTTVGSSCSFESQHSTSDATTARIWTLTGLQKAGHIRGAETVTRVACTRSDQNQGTASCAVS